MKINETPFQVTDGESASVTNSQGKGRLENPDLNFMNMMLSVSRSSSALSGASLLKGQVSVTEPALETSETVDEVSSSSKKNMKEAKAEMTRLYDELSRVRVNNELEMLQGELKSGDIQFLEQVLLAGLPYQGGVPFQQVMPIDGQGRPDFGKLGSSEDLSALLEKSYKSGRPLRVELDGRSSVVLKFQGGKVSAEFLTQDPAMAMYLKQYMDELRQRLSEKDLPVAQLTYRDDKGDSGGQEQTDSSRENEE